MILRTRRVWLMTGSRILKEDQERGNLWIATLTGGLDSWIEIRTLLISWGGEKK